MRKETNPATSQSASRTIAILEYLAEHERVSLADLAGDLQLNKATAHRFLASLIAAGYVRQDERSRDYMLTTRVLGLASQLLERTEVRHVARPLMEQLAARTSETVHLGILDDLEVIYIDKVEGGQTVRMASMVGGRAKCHSTGLGKVLLSAGSESDWSDCVKRHGQEPRTPATITTLEGLYEELQKVRERGYAVDDGENESGIRCVAAPIFDHLGAVVAALSVSGWTMSITRERLPDLIEEVVATGSAISRSLGYAPSDRTTEAG